MLRLINAGPLSPALQWIPCSEKLPEYGTKCLVTFHEDKINRDRIGISYCYMQKEGFWTDIPFEYRVVAWMPLPEPYRAERVEN